jgi:hypothetical protein
MASLLATASVTETVPATDEATAADLPVEKQPTTSAQAKKSKLIVTALATPPTEEQAAELVLRGHLPQALSAYKAIAASPHSTPAIEAMVQVLSQHNREQGQQ